MNTGLNNAVLPCLPMAAGRYYFVPNSTSTSTNGSLTNNLARSVPCFIPQRVAITKIGAEVTTIGEAGSKVRLGIYDNNPTTMRPGNLVVDAGQIAGDSATVQELTVTGVTIGPGWYWFTQAIQSAPTTVPTMRTCSGGSIFPPIEAGTSIPSAGMLTVGVQMNGASGALPSTYTYGGNIQACPRIFIKT